MTKIKFDINKRSNKKNNQIRREGRIPANVYQPGEKSISLELDSLVFAKLYQKAGDTSLIYLNIEDQETSIPVMVDEIQYDSFGKIIHVVFRKVKLTEKITAHIPVELVGEFDVPESVLVLVKDEIEVEALPTNFPEKFEIDKSKLSKIGDSFVLADLDYDKSKLTLVLNEDEKPEEITILSVKEQREEEVEEIPTELEEPERVGGDKEEDDAGSPDEKSDGKSEKKSEEKVKEESKE